MTKVFSNIWFWLENSRFFTVPMSFFSWLVVFTYAFFHGGNVFNGILALIGICCGQLATNLFDDYIDYKVLTKKGTLHKQTKSKCKYILEGKATLDDVFNVVCIYCSIAIIIGFYLFLNTGFPVIIYAILGGIFVLTYAKWSSSGLGEVAVGIVFGPILFNGVYWVMTKMFSVDVLILSIIHVMFTIGLLYTNALLDFDGDKASQKPTLCQKFGNKDKALIGFGIIYGVGYGLLIYNVFSGFFSAFYIIALLTAPLAVELINSLSLFNKDKNSIPHKRFWDKPFENWDKIKNTDIASFRFRMYQARNLQMYFSIFLSLAIILQYKLWY